MISRLLKAILKHKKITVIVLILIVIGSYFTYHNLTKGKNAVRYVTAAVEKGTVVVSVSGSGQVSASNQVDIKSKASGNVVNLEVTDGQDVKAGKLIAQLDQTDAQKTVRDAEISLQTAKISLEQAKNSENDLENTLKKTYEDGFNTVGKTLSDSADIMNNLHDILFSDTIAGSNQWNLDVFLSYAEPSANNQSNSIESGNNIYYNSYHKAKDSYEKNFADYKPVSRSSDQATIKSLIDETYETTSFISETIKNTHNLVQLYKDKKLQSSSTINSNINTYLTNLDSYRDKINTDLINLLTTKNTIENNAGIDPLNIQSKEYAVEQSENKLSDAKEALLDYSIYAPFDGIISAVSIKEGDSASAGTAIATLITNQQIAEISLNEVDAAKVKIGQKATLTFDALPGLSITGKVSEIDIIGTVSQGVVSYNVKIVLDTQDENVKPGMSVTADIITDIKQDVLVVSNNAIKSQGNSKYVELVENSDNKKQQLLSNNNSGITLPVLPKQQSVETGLSDDSYTEIVSGLKEGDIVVTSTINPGQTQTSSQSQNSFRIPGVTTGGGEQRVIQGGRIPD